MNNHEINRRLSRYEITIQIYIFKKRHNSGQLKKLHRMIKKILSSFYQINHAKRKLISVICNNKEFVTELKTTFIFH